MESFPPQVDIDLIRDHASRHLRIGDEEHVLIRGARECDAAQLTYGAVRTVASADPRGADLAGRAIRLLERSRDLARFLLEPDQLGIPLHRHAPVTESVAHNPFVVVLAEDQNERIRSHGSPGFAKRDTPHPPPLRPHVCACAGLAELECPIDDTELRIDFQGARLHAQRPRLKRRSGMPVDDQRTHAAPPELIGEHQPGRASSDDQNVGIHRRPPQRENESKTPR